MARCWTGSRRRRQKSARLPGKREGRVRLGGARGFGRGSSAGPCPVYPAAGPGHPRGGGTSGPAPHRSGAAAAVPPGGKGAAGGAGGGPDRGGETRTETIKGANKPTFEITSEGNNLLINAKDEEGISKISITVDGVTTDTGNTPINQKEVTARQELTSGSHTITVIVTNMSGLTEEQSFTAVL